VILLEEHSPAGVEEMNKVLAMSPSNTEARLRLAEYYLAQSQPAEARQYAEEALRLEPSSLSGHMLKGEILSASSDFPGAVAELEQAKRLAPRDSRVLWALLRAYSAAGRRDDAARLKAEIEKSGSKVEVAQ
jgi:predicted Zn-dependent protease